MDKDKWFNFFMIQRIRLINGVKMIAPEYTEEQVELEVNKMFKNIEEELTNGRKRS